MDNNNKLPQSTIDQIEAIFAKYGHSGCVAACKSAYQSCLNGCPNPPDPTGCREGCRDSLQSCINSCPDSNAEQTKQLIAELAQLDS